MPPQYVVTVSPKSMGLAVVLAIFFGPLGLLYSAPVGALILCVLFIPVAFATAGLGALVFWIASCIWAAIAVDNHNTRIQRLAQGQ